MINVTKGDWKFSFRPTIAKDARGNSFNVLTGSVDIYDGTKFLGEVCTLQSEENVKGIPQAEAFNNGQAIQMVPEMLALLDTLAGTGPWETAKLEGLISKAKILKSKVKTISVV